MKKFLVLALLLASPAFSQEPAPKLQEKPDDFLVRQLRDYSNSCYRDWIAQVTKMGQEYIALTQQLADTAGKLTAAIKERDDLKAKLETAPAETAK